MSGFALTQYLLTSPCLQACLKVSGRTCSSTITCVPPISAIFNDLAKPSSSADGAPSFTSAVAPVALHPIIMNC